MATKKEKAVATIVIASTAKSPLRIVVGQRGWVWIGRVTQTASEVVMTDASCIRYWGTKQGLGELVNGPTPSTKLDPVGTLRLHPLGIVAQYDVNEEAWRGR